MNIRLPSESAAPPAESSIQINGKPAAIDAPVTLAELLQVLNVRDRGIAVEINGQLVPRREFPSFLVQCGDQVEIASLAGGG